MSHHPTSSLTLYWREPRSCIGCKKKSVLFFRIYFGGLGTRAIFSHHKQVHICWIKKISAKNIDFKNFHAQHYFLFFSLSRNICCQNASKIVPNFNRLVLRAQKELGVHISTPDKYQMYFSSQMKKFHAALKLSDHNSNTLIDLFTVYEQRF